MNLTQLKTLFRKKVKVVPGGPTNVTRGVDMLEVLDALAETASQGPNLRPDLLKGVRYYLAADRDADQYGGDCFEELDKTLCCQFTVITVEFYRTDASQPFQYGKRLVAVYDSSVTPAATINRSASFSSAPGSLVPAKFVPIDSAAAAYGYVRRDTAPATITDWHVGELSIWEIAGADQFATLKQAGGPFPAFTGVEDAYYKPAAKPGPPDLTAIVNQHTQQLATLGVQGSAVYGYLESGGAPVGYATLDEALADPRQKTFLRFNKASLSITRNNIGAGSFYVNGEGATITLSPNVTYTLPGDNIGSLYLERFYLEGGRGSRINLLTSAPAATPTALLPRLDGYFNCPVWLLNGGAVALKGYYLSLNGTGTVYALEPFQCDSVAAGVTVVRAGAGAGTVKTVNGVAPDAAGAVTLPQLDLYGYSAAKRSQVFGLFTTANQVKAVDVPLAGDTSTGIGSVIPDLNNGARYELLPDPDNPMPGPGGTVIGTPTWLRT